MRTKMPRGDRARQFAPFDALKGLQEALRLKEYEHERIQKGDIPEEKIEEISKVLSELEKNDQVEITFFYDGYYRTLVGKSKVDVYEQKINVNGQLISFDDITDLKKLL